MSALADELQIFGVQFELADVDKPGSILSCAEWSARFARTHTPVLNRDKDAAAAD